MVLIYYYNGGHISTVPNRQRGVQVLTWYFILFVTTKTEEQAWEGASIRGYHELRGYRERNSQQEDREPSKLLQQTVATRKSRRKEIMRMEETNLVLRLFIVHVHISQVLL